MIDWNYWPDWNWYKALRKPGWAAGILGPKVPDDEVDLRLEPPKDLKLIQTPEEYDWLLETIRTAPFIAFDTEGNGTNPFAGNFEVAGLCFAFNIKQGYYLPLNHKTPDFKFQRLFKNYKLPFKNFDQKEVLRDLLKVGFDKKPLICHSSSYEFHVEYQLSRMTDTLEYIGHRGPILDTLFYYRVEDPLRDNGLKGITASKFGYMPIEFKEALGKDAVFNDTDPRKSKDYAAADPVNTLRHAYYMMNEGFLDNVYDVCNILEWPLALKLPEVEQFGVRLDAPQLGEYSAVIKPHLERLAKEMRRLTGRDINPNSHEEKFNLVFSELRAPTPDGSKPKGTGAAELKEVNTYLPTIIQKLEETKKELLTYMKGRSGLSDMIAKVYIVLRSANAIYSQLDAITIPVDQRKAALTKHVIQIFKWIDESIARLKRTLQIVGMLQQYVGLSKLNSAFLEALPNKVSPQDGLLHTRFNQIVRSGRQSGTDPNLMQLPRDDEYTIYYPDMALEEIKLLAGDCEVNDKNEIIIPADVRSCILPPEGWVFVRADLDAAEMRMLAAISGCPVLTDVVLGKDEFGNDFDPHLKSVELLKLMKEPYAVLKEALDDKKHKIHKQVKKWRQMIKPINFGLVYGITEFGLAAQLDVTPEFARSLMDKYFKVYYGVAAWLKKAHEDARNIGYSETVIGRRRTIPPQAYSDENELKHYVRACGNHVIQGNITGDIAKFCERQALDALEQNVHILKRSRNFSNYIHDEFVVACIDDPETVQYCASVLYITMQKTVSGIPFTCSAEVTHDLSKKAKNYIDDYPDYKDPILLDKIAVKLGFENHQALQFLPWWGAEKDALNTTAA